jgi:transporter family protein
MERWVGYALLSMAFAGVTSVIAKQGLTGISGELGVVVRTLYVALFIGCFALLAVAPAEWKTLQRSNLFWLGLSSATTAISWVYYYKALKLGDVATVALIDKGSTVVAIFFAWLILKEVITLRIVFGAVLIILGVFVISKK